MTSVIVPPVDLAPGMPSRVVTISATDVTEGGKSLAGQMVRFALSDTLDVSSGGDVIAKTQAEVVLDANGNGSIRLPVYSDAVKTWCGQDWAILVTATWGSQKAIRVPAGTSSVALSSLPPVRPLRGREKQWAITGASVTVQTGASPGGTASVSGGVLNLSLTIPPMGEGAVLGTTHLDTVTTPGPYRQIANATATTDLGYPVAGVGGTLWVEHRSSGIAVQTFTPLGAAPYRQYVRTNYFRGEWGAWEGVETTGSKAGPDLGTAHLDTITAAGLHRQPANAAATVARGYPVEGVGGTLFVQTRSGSVASQLFTPIGDTPYRMYWRSNWWANTWSAWEGIETSSSRSGPDLGETNLNTVTATGIYRQPASALVTTGRGYPAGATGGALQVIARDSTVAAQVYWSIGQALEAQAHYRVATGDGWSTWRPLGGSSGGGGGVDESALLAGYEAALEGM